MIIAVVKMLNVFPRFSNLFRPPPSVPLFVSAFLLPVKRNRCFRLVGSSKYGKSAALKVAVTNKRTLEHMERRGARPSMSRDSGGAARTVLVSKDFRRRKLRPVTDGRLDVPYVTDGRLYVAYVMDDRLDVTSVSDGRLEVTHVTE